MPHSLVKIYVHVVWTTRDRQPVIDAVWRGRLYGVIIHAAEAAGCQVNEIGGTTDHVHVLIRLSGTVTIAQVVQRMKGASSHFVTKEIGLAFQWQSSYAAFSVAYNDLMPLRNYIRHQERHHSNGSILPEFEPPPDL
jgi:putative transposase